VLLIAHLPLEGFGRKKFAGRRQPRCLWGPGPAYGVVNFESLQVEKKGGVIFGINLVVSVYIGTSPELLQTFA
jgi:hypothetical protein